jgi:hypothetical protein
MRRRKTELVACALPSSPWLYIQSEARQGIAFHPMAMLGGVSTDEPAYAGRGFWFESAEAPTTLCIRRTGAAAVGHYRSITRAGAAAEGYYRYVFR